MSDKHHYVNRKFKIKDFIFKTRKHKLSNFISINHIKTSSCFVRLYSGRKKTGKEYIGKTGKRKPAGFHIKIPKQKNHKLTGGKKQK
jgi:hypothetical protein